MYGLSKDNIISVIQYINIFKVKVRRHTCIYRCLSIQKQIENLAECGLGMQDKNVVKDRQITCGSYHGNRENHSCKHARLFGTTGASAWVAGYNTATLTNGGNSY